MGSRRGRLNWSNLEVRISNEVVEKQHRFTFHNSPLSTSASIENTIDDENEPTPTPPLPTKGSWKPKAGVGDMKAEQFVGNFMLTNAEQTAIDKKYNKRATDVVCSKAVTASKPIRLSNRLLSTPDTPISIRTTNLSVGQHLLNVFVCHVESFSCVYIMFGDDYNRAMELFQEMNSCDELTRPSTTIFEPKEKDLVALYHEKKWFRGQCLSLTDTNINVLCIDSGVVIACARNDLRRLPDRFRTCSPCCIECSLSGLPANTPLSSMPESIHNASIDLLYKDRYEAIVTKLDSSNCPTIVMYYGDKNINDTLLAILNMI